TKIARIRQIVLAEPMLVKRLISADGSLAAVNITVQLPEKNQQQEVTDVVSSVQQLTTALQAEYPQLRFYHGGVMALNHAFSTEAQHDATVLVPSMFLTIIVLLALLLRSALAALAVV
ncbi:RND family transporter, partial [Enterococcus faecium]|uniref:MMPL family transporter n=1 Tax=Enterococcus faecium TaxID=1352 RepID=UPI001137D2AB